MKDFNPSPNMQRKLEFRLYGDDIKIETNDALMAAMYKITATYIKGYMYMESLFT